MERLWNSYIMCVYTYMHIQTGWVVSLSTGKHELSTYGLMSQNFRCNTAVEKWATERPLVKSTVITNEAQMVSVHLKNLRSWTKSIHLQQFYEFFFLCFADCASQYIFILVINQLDAQNLFYNKFISCRYMFRAMCSKHVEAWNKLIVKQNLYIKLVNY